jgi:hypothetical protein
MTAQVTLKAFQIVAPVIANPQGEASHARTLDCFTLRVRNDEGCQGYRHYKELHGVALHSGRKHMGHTSDI